MRVTTMMAAAALALAASTGAAAQRQVNERAPADATGSVAVRLQDGQVRVVGWDRNEVQVTGTLSSEDARLVLDHDGPGLEVRVEGPGGTYMRHAGREGGTGGGMLEVRVPARSSLEVSSTTATVIVQGVDGHTEAHSVSGSVTLSGGRATDVEAISRSGSVDVTADADRVEAVSISGSVRVAGTVREHVEASSVSGEVTVSATTGEVEANSVSGGVTVAAMRGRAEVHSVSGGIHVTGRELSGEFQTVSGEVVLTGDLAHGADVQVTSHSGDVVLQLARGASAQVDADSFTGDILSDYPGARITRTSQRKARIVVGDGDARVEVRTFSGDVKLAEH